MKKVEDQIATILDRQKQTIQLTEELTRKIDELLNPEQPEHLTIKDACFALGRTNSILIKWSRELGIEPEHFGATKVFKYSDIERIAQRIGVKLRNVAA